MKEIHLGHGMVALIDDDDFSSVSGIKWRAVRHRRTFYAVASPYIDGKQTTIRMHRRILNACRSTIIDHRNGNGLDNTRGNLRIATSIQNSQNRRFTAGSYKGVHKRSDRSSGKVWIARIQVNHGSILVGCFLTAEDAARAYDAAARQYFGEFAATNFQS